ncbi:hypothetical protein [Amycolatopsis sp. NPDC052450]|uniref:hypothetical protein n=1 Tax=Amycolatopsis sp. NPDC052450 TaxID=3363937 RepID=UPI0037CBF225
MSTLVRYIRGEDDRLIDLAHLNSRDFELIRSLRGEIRRHDRILLCQQAPVDDDGAEMFVRLVGDRYWAVHFRGSSCTSDHEIAEESVEHRRQKDYWQRAAEDAGYPVTQERRTGRGTILDVAIDGPYRTGIEVQRSAIESTLVKSRTTKSFSAGWLPVWFLDSDRTPPWFTQVPALGCNKLAWTTLPPPRAATALGPRRMIPTRCTISTWDYCPTGGRHRGKRTRPPRVCGRMHPNPEPWIGLTVDDVAERLPAGELVAMRDLLGDVRLVSPTDLELFQEMTEQTGEYQPGRPTKPRGQSAPHTAECLNPEHPRVSARRCGKCGLRPPGPGGVLCSACRLMLEGRTARDYYSRL